MPEKSFSLPFLFINQVTYLQIIKRSPYCQVIQVHLHQHEFQQGAKEKTKGVNR